MTDYHDLLWAGVGKWTNVFHHCLLTDYMSDNDFQYLDFL